MSPRGAAIGLLVAAGACLLWLASRPQQPRQTVQAAPATAAPSLPGEPADVLLPSPPQDVPRIRVPNRPPLSDADAPQPASEPAGFIDLTNLIDAANGDPVLFSYYGVVREQIQYMAGAKTWLSGPAEGGLVYVSFVVNEDGSLRGAAVVPERSVESRPLREAAVQIVLNAGPFPPPPPSMPAVPATLVVPLEFLVGP